MSKTDSPSGAPNTFPHVSTDPEADVAPIADEAAHPGKYDDQKGSPEVENSILASSYIGADKYAQKRESFWNVYRSTTFQFLIVGCLAFAGPAQGDAIANLGGGGLATPYTANAANAGSYAFSAAVALFGGPIVGKIGLKWAMIIGAATFPLEGSSMYCNSAFGNQTYMIVAYCISGIGSALWYVSETGIVLSYPEPGRRGAFLAWWIVSRNLGQLIGGAINLSVNVKNNVGGGVSPKTYLIFLGIECLGVPAALLFSQPNKVRRKDGTKVVTAPKLTFKEELAALWKVIAKPRTLMLLPYFFISFFYIPVYGTYLNLHFSVRARALSSLIAPAFCIFGCFALGWVLDSKRFSQPTRAKIGFIGCIAIPTIGGPLLRNSANHNFDMLITLAVIGIYTFVVLAGWEKDPISAAKHYDWADKGWARAYMPFFLIQTFGPMSQSFMFWLLSCFAEDVQTNTRNGGVFRSMESVGMAVCYGINSHANTILAGMGVYYGVFILMVPLTWLVIRTVPEISPMEAKANEERDRELRESEALKR